MAPVITNGVNSATGANNKGGQSPKMHSKVVSISLVAISLWGALAPVAQIDIPLDAKNG